MAEKVLLFGEINKEKAAEVCGRIYDLASEGNESVDLVINSPGGVFDDALAIVACMNSVEMCINTIGWGEVSSSALMVLANGKKREIGKNTFIITHQVYTDGHISGFSHELRKEIEIIDSMNETFLNLLLKRTKSTKEDLQEQIFTPKDTKIAADLLFSLGLVDHVIDEF